MKITLQTLLYFMEDKDCRISPSMPEKVSFSDVILLGPGQETVSEEWLWIGSAKEVIRRVDLMQGTEQEFCAVCPAEDMEDMEHLPDRVHWICFPSCTSLIETFNRVYGVFQKLQRWDRYLDEIILTGQDMDVMLSAYTEIVPKHLFMWDASFNICAYTRNIEPPTELVARIEEKGYFLPEVVEMLINKNLIADSTNTSTRILSEGVLPSGQSAWIHHYFRQGLRFYSVCVYGVGADCDPGIIDVAEHFFNRLNFYLDKNAPSFREQHYLYESFLTSLLDEKLIDPREIEEKGRMYRFHPDSIYYLYCLQISDFRTTLARYLMEMVSSYAPDVKFLLYDQMILILKAQPKGDIMPPDIRQAWQNRLTRLLEMYNAYCGVSSTFDRLENLRVAYQQARSALRFGRMFSPNEESRSYYYKDYYLYHLFFSANDSTPTQSLYLKTMNILLEEDLKKGSNHLELLTRYMSTNCSVSETAKQMFMHRNSVLYRINKLEEILGVNLEQHADMFRVDFSLQLLRYMAVTNPEYKKYRPLFPYFSESPLTE